MHKSLKAMLLNFLVEGSAVVALPVVLLMEVNADIIAN
jgi:hypothetical protein